MNQTLSNTLRLGLEHSILTIGGKERKETTKKLQKMKFSKSNVTLTNFEEEGYKLEE